MANPSILDRGGSALPGSQSPNLDPSAEGAQGETPASGESFGALLKEFEQTHAHAEGGEKGLEGTVVAVTGDSVFIDIGYKIEGIIPLADFQNEPVKAGEKLPVSIKGRGEGGYYELSRIKVARPKDWSSLEKAFAEKATIIGVVSSAIKGGLS